MDLFDHLDRARARHIEADLFKAAAKGDLAGTRLALHAGADIRADSDKAIFLAAHAGHRELVQYLLDSGVPADASLSRALTAAAEQGHADIVEDLLREGAWGTGITFLGIHKYTADVQMAFARAGEFRAMSAMGLARAGVPPEGLYILLERQGQHQVSTLLRATQMIESLAPAARAEALEDVLQKYGNPAPRRPGVPEQLSKVSAKGDISIVKKLLLTGASSEDALADETGPASFGPAGR